MKRIILIFLFSVFLFSCSLDNDDVYSYYKTELVPIDQIDFPDSFNYEAEYTIPFKYSLPNGCYYYDNLYYTTQGATRTIAIQVSVDASPDVVCTEAVVQEEDEFFLTVSQTEDYTFKIWKGVDDDGQDVYDEIIVPVLEPDEQP